MNSMLPIYQTNGLDDFHIDIKQSHRSRARKYVSEDEIKDKSKFSHVVRTSVHTSSHCQIKSNKTSADIVFAHTCEFAYMAKMVKHLFFTSLHRKRARALCRHVLNRENATIIEYSVSLRLTRLLCVYPLSLSEQKAIFLTPFAF